MITFTLTDYEITHCFDVATRRQNIKVRNRVPLTRVTRTQSSLEVHCQGFCCEWVVGVRMLRVHPNEDIHVHGDGGVDLQVGMCTVQTKSSAKGSHLLFNDLSEFSAHIAVFCKFQQPNIHVVGWITKEEFTQLCFHRDFGYGDRVAVRPDQLNSPERLAYGVYSRSGLPIPDWVQCPAQHKQKQMELL